MIKYKYLRAWDIMMGSSQSWMEMTQRKAEEENTPEDVIYFEPNGKWHRFVDITSDYTKQRVQKMVDKMGELI